MNILYKRLRFRKLLLQMNYAFTRFSNILNIHYCSKCESVKGKKLLGKHLDNQIQMGCQYVPKITLLQP